MRPDKERLSKPENKGYPIQKPQEKNNDPEMNRRNFLLFLSGLFATVAAASPEKIFAGIEESNGYSQLDQWQRNFLKQFEARMKESGISNYRGNVKKLSRMLLENRNMEEVKKVARVMEQGASDRMINKIINRYEKDEYLPSQGYDLYYYIEPVIQGEEAIFNEVALYTKDGRWELKDFIQLRNYDAKNNKDPFFESKLGEKDKENLRKQLDKQAEKIIQKEKEIFRKLKKECDDVKSCQKEVLNEKDRKVKRIRNIFDILYWFRAEKGLLGNLEWRELNFPDKDAPYFFGLKADSDYYGSGALEVGFYTTGKIKISLTIGPIIKDVYFQKNEQNISLEVVSKDSAKRSSGSDNEFYQINEEDFNGQYLRSLLLNQ
ncbi:MAG: hypothetical protein GF335_04695 [Candidatus Moranbacteria bacterium]|nr:hypothetical protein [Candidatus Moranbacteria bacterium]